MANPPTMADLVRLEQGLEIWCCVHACRHEAYLTPPDAVALLGGTTTMAQAERRLRCSACGARGQDGWIGCRPSSLDYAARMQREREKVRR